MIVIARIESLINKSRAKTFAELERECGLANGTLGKWKSGAYKPSLEYLERVADYFNVSIDYLVGRDDVPKRD